MLDNIFRSPTKQLQGNNHFKNLRQQLCLLPQIPLHFRDFSKDQYGSIELCPAFISEETVPDGTTIGFGADQVCDVAVSLQDNVTGTVDDLSIGVAGDIV